MTQSWLVALYLDCSAIASESLPELHCPNATAVASFEAAIWRGDIWWHAFPHNAELAAADAGMIKAGINITHTLDARFGLPPKRTLSQRDVPGISRATVPILSAAGVPYISIGTNNGPYKPVSLPNAFVWRDPASKTETIVTWHNFGYGSIEDGGKTGAWEDCADGNDGCEDGLAEPAYLQIPGYDQALVLDWKNDNSGPPGCNRDTKQADDLAGNGTAFCNLTAGVAQVLADYATVRKLFPGAAVVASDFDQFMSGLESRKAQLPVVDGELAEGWIYGIASDPIKLQRMRELARARNAWVASGAAAAHPTEVRRFTLLSTKNSEYVSQASSCHCHSA